MHSHPFLRRALTLLWLVAVLLMLVMATAAVAATGGTPTIVNIFDTAQLLALAGGVLLPFVVALLAKVNASALVKAAIATVSAGVLALGTYLTNTSGGHTWEGAISVFVITIVIAAGSRVTITGGADTALAKKIPGGIG